MDQRKPCECEQDAPPCHEASDSGYLCTRNAGHGGAHVACSSDEHLRTAWNNDPDTEEKEAPEPEEPVVVTDIGDGEWAQPCPRFGPAHDFEPLHNELTFGYVSKSYIIAVCRKCGVRR